MIMSTNKKKKAYQKGANKKGKGQSGERPKMPPRPWRGEGSSGSAASALMKVQGLHGTDVRAPVGKTAGGAKDDMVVTGSTNVLPVKCVFIDRSVSYLAMGIVLKACQKGFISSDSSFKTCPYYAFRYIIECVKSAMDGNIPQLQQAPLWFWDLLYAMKQKTVRFKTSEVKYSWVEQQSGLADDVAFVLGTAVDAYVLFWGVPGGAGSINQIPLLAAPPAYTPGTKQGPDSFNAMLSFYGGEGQGMMTGDPGSSPFDRDSSAFAAVFPELGESFFSPGAFKNTLQSERQIDCPVLAKFAQYQDSLYRGWQQEKVSAGSACYLGARASELGGLSTWRNKTPPIFKTYNFDEFFYQLSKTLALALENCNVNVLPDIKPCPLTPLQVQLILRQNLLPYFNNEMAQDLRFQGPDWVDLLPLTVGPNGVSFGRQSMYIPTFLAENIKVCKRLTHQLNGRGKRAQVLDMVPVLCRSPERAQLGNFTYGETGALVYATQVEVAVNLIDLSAVLNSATVYLDLDSEPYTAMVTAWNEWIQTLQTVLSSLVPLSGEGGAAALATVVYTNFQRTIVPPQPNDAPQGVQVAGKVIEGKMLEKKGSAKNIHIGGVIPRKNKGVGAAPVPGTSYFDTVGDVRMSSSVGFNKHLWSYISLFIVPISWSDLGGGIASTSPVQSFQCEGTFILRSTGNNGAIGGGNAPSAEERMCLAAAVDVKQVTQDGDHILIQQLKELTSKGEGGFFTSIAGLIGDALGVPEVRSVANMVGKVTGL